MNNSKDEDLIETIALLEKQIADKDLEIKKLMDRISECEKAMIFKDSTKEISNPSWFRCDHCEFTTDYKVGLKFIYVRSISLNVKVKLLRKFLTK